MGLGLADLGQRLRAGGRRCGHRRAGCRAGRSAGRRRRSAAAGRCAAAGRRRACGGRTARARGASWCGTPPYTRKPLTPPPSRIVCNPELGVGRWGAYPDVDLELESFTLTQAQTQTLRTVRALRTLRALRALRALRTLPSASVADPNKSTFTVTLKTPDGDIVFECPPDQYVLDEAEEQEIEGADGLPYACRAGSCSACTGKVPPPAPAPSC